MIRRPPRSDLAVGLQALYHHLPLGLVIPEVPEELFLIRIILADPLKASLHEALDVPLVESQTEIEEVPTFPKFASTNSSRSLPLPVGRLTRPIQRRGYFLRLLRLLRNLSAEIVRYGAVAGSGPKPSM